MRIFSWQCLRALWWIHGSSFDAASGSNLKAESSPVLATSFQCAAWRIAMPSVAQWCISYAKCGSVVHSSIRSFGSLAYPLVSSKSCFAETPYWKPVMEKRSSQQSQWHFLTWSPMFMGRCSQLRGPPSSHPESSPVLATSFQCAAWGIAMPSVAQWCISYAKCGSVVHSSIRSFGSLAYPLASSKSCFAETPYWKPVMEKRSSQQSQWHFLT